ncbi:hypothetical protein Dimus_006201, partial [Dionaea muscipula]
MGRKKKKWIPFSQWTPVVSGLSPDVSEKNSATADLETSKPLEPLVEGDEMISEEESCPSLNGDPINPIIGVDIESQHNPALIEEIDVLHAVVNDSAAEFDAVTEDVELNTGIPRLLHAIGLTDNLPHSEIDGFQHHPASDSVLAE